MGISGLKYTLLLVHKTKLGHEIGLLSTGYKVHRGWGMDKPWLLKFDTREQAEREAKAINEGRRNQAVHVSKEYRAYVTEFINGAKKDRSPRKANSHQLPLFYHR
jgi:hypothetical protein